MNRFTPDNQSVLDADDKPWPVNTAHPIPIPYGIEGAIYAHPDDPWHAPRNPFDTHWLVQAPLPPVPADKPKTQDDMDLEAFEEWIKRDAFQIDRNGMEYAYAINAFRTACNYARKNP